MTIATMGRRMKKFSHRLLDAAGVWGAGWARQAEVRSGAKPGGSLAATVATTTMPSRTFWHPLDDHLLARLDSFLEDQRLPTAGRADVPAWACSRAHHQDRELALQLLNRPLGDRAARPCGALPCTGAFRRCPAEGCASDWETSDRRAASRSGDRPRRSRKAGARARIDGSVCEDDCAPASSCGCAPTGRRVQPIGIAEKQRFGNVHAARIGSIEEIVSASVGSPCRRDRRSCAGPGRSDLQMGAVTRV